MKLLNRWAARTLRNERALVEDPARARRVWLSSAALFLLALAAILTRLWWAPGSSWDLAAGLVLGSLAGWGALCGFVRMAAYRSGWLDGRHQMIRALAEGLDRGMAPEEWLQSEYERDLYVLGVGPATLPEEDV